MRLYVCVSQLVRKYVSATVKKETTTNTTRQLKHTCADAALYGVRRLFVRLRIGIRVARPFKDIRMIEVVSILYPQLIGVCVCGVHVSYEIVVRESNTHTHINTLGQIRVVG